MRREWGDGRVDLRKQKLADAALRSVYPSFSTVE